MSEDQLKEIAENQKKKEEKVLFITLVLIICTIVGFFVSLLVGSNSYPPETMIDTILGKGTWGSYFVLHNLRIPRSLCVIAVGAGLSIAGVAMQSLFKNPMASPSILGLSSGASFGASLSIAFGIGAIFGSLSTPIMAFVFCMITMLLVYGLSVTRYGTPVTLLLLSGVAVGAFFSGMTSFIQYVVEPDILQGVVYWTLGSFSRSSWTSVYYGIPTIIIGIIMIAMCHKELNLISLGEEQAKTLGINIRRTRILLLIGTSLCVGGAVAIAGVIGFVGLIIPHVCRAMVGPNHSILIIVSIFTGAIFMLIMDCICRYLGEIPVGVLTSLLGAPFFIYIMRKKKSEFWGA